MKRLHSLQQKRLTRAFWTTLVVLAMLLIPATQLAFASGDGPGTLPVAGPSSPAALPHQNDANQREVGAEGAGGNLQAYAASEASSLVTRLQSCGWTKNYLWTNNNSWEQDFKRVADGGTEPWWMDSVDLAFYVGHGGPGSFTFDSNVDDHWLTPAECYQSWGTSDNEWLALTSCQVLSGAHPNPWANCMYGQHVLLGFTSNAGARMGTATQGYQFANYLCYGWPVTSAWFKACDITQAGGGRTVAFAEEAACFNDIPGVVKCNESTFNWASYFYINHTCGSPVPKPMKVTDVTEMPVFTVEPLSLAAANDLSTKLGTLFTMTPPAQAVAGPGKVPTACNAGQTWVSTSADGKHELEMDCSTGQFTYYDKSVWSGAAVQTSLALAQSKAPLVTADAAKDIADAFLSANGLLPGDAVYSETVQDTTAMPSKTGNAPVAETPLVWQVIYGREVTSTVVATGKAAEETWQVLGPGGKLKVLVPMQAIVSAAGTNVVPVVGTQGGWPKVGGAGLRPTAVMTVSILSEAQVLAMHANPVLEPMVVMNTPPISATVHNVLTTTLGYWSDGMSQPQPELIPSWVLSVEYFNGPIDEGHGWEYIPANPTYMRPYAKIASYPQGEVVAGTTIQLTAADASQTLAALGYGQSLDFPLGNGPYLYNWYVDSVDPANQIGTQRSISWLVKAANDVKQGNFSRNIILRVTDSGSSASAFTTDTIALPIDTKNLSLPTTLR